MNNSKIQKISFESINKDNYSIIPPEKIIESNNRIKNEMNPIIKLHIKKINQSIINTKKILTICGKTK